MDLSSIDRVVQFCREYQKTKGGSDPEFESYMAQLLAVKAAGAFEEYIEFCIGLRADATKDERIARLVRSRIAKTFRNPDWGNVKGQLKELGEDLPRAIENGSTARQRQALDNLMLHKNDVAHTFGSSITLNEAIVWYEDARSLVTLIGDSISKATS